MSRVPHTIDYSDHKRHGEWDGKHRVHMGEDMGEWVLESQYSFMSYWMLWGKYKAFPEEHANHSKKNSMSKMLCNCEPMAVGESLEDCIATYRAYLEKKRRDGPVPLRLEAVSDRLRNTKTGEVIPCEALCA